MSYQTHPKITANFSEVLIEVWRQALGDKADTVKLGSESYRVTQSKAKRLRQVEFVLEGRTIIGIEQNPNTKSKWAEQARAGKKVMQFIQDGRYIAVVAGGNFSGTITAAAAAALPFTNTPRSAASPTATPPKHRGDFLGMRDEN
jgi:hypothetical protein